MGDETQIWSYGIRVEACGAIYCWCSPIRGGMGVGGSGSRKPSRECFFLYVSANAFSCMCHIAYWFVCLEYVDSAT